MSRHSHDHSNTSLTRNQSLVFAALAEAAGPLSAYTILDQLRDAGFRAPLQVYRALEKLLEIGLVHRLESLNAFVACRQPDCEIHSTTAFTICATCGKVGEIADPAFTSQIEALAGQTGFALKKSTVELRGTCSACQAA